MNLIGWPTGQALLDPVQEVQALAGDLGKERDVRVVTCGVYTQTADVQLALTECMQSGDWLVLQNMHLAHEWDSHTLGMFKVRVRPLPLEVFVGWELFMWWPRVISHIVKIICILFKKWKETVLPFSVQCTVFK